MTDRSTSPPTPGTPACGLAHAAPNTTCGAWPGQIAVITVDNRLLVGCTTHAAHLVAFHNGAWISGPDGSCAAVARIAHHLEEQRMIARAAAARRPR